MDLIHALILGIVQGATEFLPVSSSGHLVLVPWLLGWEPPGLVFDTVVHLGTLAAVLAYFWRDWLHMLAGAWRSLVHRDSQAVEARLLGYLIVATCPAALLGYLLEGFFESLFGEPVWVSVFLLITAILLLVSEQLGRTRKTLQELRWADALFIGFGQAIAIAPGISRSGATISAGLLRGLRREDAARFGFLLSTPVILGAGLYQLLGLSSAANALAQVPALLVGLAAAAASGYISVWRLLRYLQRGRLYPFALYCAVMGMLCLVVACLR